ncbi:MAG: NitT/TauT family transport system permease protein [Rubritepida sp.]|nr:NitT/TauT family transport system permease protein [Rubritepida sp.]
MICWTRCWPAMSRRLVAALPGLVVLALILAGLEVAVNAGWIRRALMPPPSAIGLVLWDLLESGEFAAPLLATMKLVFSGFVIGSAIGIAGGVAMGWFPAAYRLLEPLVELVRPIPKAALVPPLMLFLGIGETMKITSVSLAVLFPVLVNTLQGVRGVDRMMLDAARTHGWGTRHTLWHLVLPAALPFILAGMRISLGLALVLAVLAEMLSGQGGLGFLILDMQRSFLIRQMYAWLVILAVLGLALNTLFLLAERRALHWQPANRP